MLAGSKSNNFIGFIAFTKQRRIFITQLYALRTIKISSVKEGTGLLISPANIFRALGKQEIMRLTAGSCLARLVCFNPYSTNHGKTFIQGYGFNLGQERNLREQQICLNILNMSLLESHTLPSVGRAKSKTRILF